jgi:hypothetical protein
VGIIKENGMPGQKYPALCLILFFVVSMILTGCGGGSGGGESVHQVDTSKKDGTYEAPVFANAKFHKKRAKGPEDAKIDVSAVKDGYVAVKAKQDSKLKFQVMKDGETYNYDLDSQGNPSVFPLQCGDGRYSFRIMQNIEGNRYAEVYSTDKKVKLKDEFQPFLRPNDYVSYRRDSACVQKAAELAKSADTDTEVVSLIYDFVCDNVKYDKEKASSVKDGYLPSPDETMETGKGICFDYASLAAAMLRSQGIPTKVIFGYVAPDDVYHAWNMFYTSETGWVTVDYEVSSDKWNRLDLTFASNGADGEFIGDGSHYTDVYTY